MALEVRGRRVLITGGTGFLGRHLVERFNAAGALVSAVGSRDYDLTSPAETQKAFAYLNPAIIVHAAANVGGIGYNVLYPADILRSNLMMTCNVLEACRQAQVEKLVIIGSACAYPGEVDGDMREDDFLSGAMHPSVEMYGLSKRALYLGAKAYRQQHGLSSIFLVLTNLYGPWDKYNPTESHVVAALIRRFVEAQRDEVPEVACWGTGAPVREFLYVKDCAEAVLRATQGYDDLAPLNIGTGIGTTIRELADMICQAVGYQGRVTWDTSRPDGAMRKVLDITRMREALQWVPPTSLQEGFAETIAWFSRHGAAVS